VNTSSRSSIANSLIVNLNPQESALNFVINDDLEKLTTLLAEVCETSDDRNPEPFPEDHWINLPFDKEAGLKTLLHLAVDKTTEHRAEKFARVLLSAGARPDLYNEHLGVAPVHVAARLVHFCGFLNFSFPWANVCCKAYSEVYEIDLVLNSN
jgi:hypothetical protein